MLQGADILAAPIENYEDVTRSEQYAACGVEIEIDHPTAGPFRMPGFGICGPASPANPPPLVGQHSREILERFDFTAAEINALVAESIIFAEDRN